MTAVDAPHIEETVDSILYQLEIIREGAFSEEELAIARKMYVNAHRSMLDDPYAILSEQFRKALVPDAEDIQTMVHAFKDMDRDSVVRAFEPVRLKTVSIVRQEGF